MEWNWKNNTIITLLLLAVSFVLLKEIRRGGGVLPATSPEPAPSETSLALNPVRPNYNARPTMFNPAAMFMPTVSGGPSSASAPMIAAGYGCDGC